MFCIFWGFREVQHRRSVRNHFQGELTICKHGTGFPNIPKPEYAWFSRFLFLPSIKRVEQRRVFCRMRSNFFSLWRYKAMRAEQSHLLIAGSLYSFRFVIRKVTESNLNPSTLNFAIPKFVVRVWRCCDLSLAVRASWALWFVALEFWDFRLPDPSVGLMRPRQAGPASWASHTPSIASLIPALATPT